MNKPAPNILPHNEGEKAMIARELEIQDNETRGHNEPMHTELARRTVKWYVCSRCWGDLTMTEVQGGAKVECVDCSDETCGYVTRYWTEQKRTRDHSDAIEVTRMLRRIGILPPAPKMTTKERIALLGFEGAMQ